MKSKITLVSTAFMFVSPVFAADLPKQPTVSSGFMEVADWTGFYIGLNGGYAFNSNNKITRPDGTERARLRDNDGSSVGGQLGYHYQIHNFLLGVDAEIGRSFASKEFDLTKGKSISASNEYIGNIRAKLGFVVSPSLAIYGAGGLAIARIKLHYINPPFDITQAEVNTGLVFGGGFQYRYTSNISIFTEYRHYGFKKTPYTELNSRSQPSNSEVRLGINYKI